MFEKRYSPLRTIRSCSHNTDGSEANHALTFKLDHLGGADQLRRQLFGAALMGPGAILAVGRIVGQII